MKALTGLRKNETTVGPYSKGAIMSNCNDYRYALWRRWGDKPGYALFVCLNPSIADHLNDDPTLRRLINFSASWGYDAVYVVNLFAYRATKARDMLTHDHPVGVKNDAVIKRFASRASVIVCAWGVDGEHRSRDMEVVKLLHDYELQCMGLTKYGHPKHPLYLKNCTPLEPYRFLGGVIDGI